MLQKKSKTLPNLCITPHQEDMHGNNDCQVYFEKLLRGIFAGFRTQHLSLGLNTLPPAEASADTSAEQCCRSADALTADRDLAVPPPPPLLSSLCCFPLAHSSEGCIGTVCPLQKLSDRAKSSRRLSSGRQQRGGTGSFGSSGCAVRIRRGMVWFCKETERKRDEEGDDSAASPNSPPPSAPLC